MTTNQLIDINVLFDQTLELRHISGLLYTLANNLPCTCEDGEPVCGDPICEDCVDRVPCVRCATMIRYEQWVGYENLPFLHPQSRYIGYRPQCSSYLDESLPDDDDRG